MVAAISAFVLWIPIRILIWAIRDTSKGLFSGTDPVFTPGRILGQIVFAAALRRLRRLDRVAPRRRAAGSVDA